ncbi:ABC transporter permease [Lutispora thermophila]|uniref:ABC transporter permease n=1 Tax=Lutispora thermophila TaxID=288966 RepID=UPI001587EA82|nr:ABC transporter permease [Lutispora thermophila]
MTIILKYILTNLKEHKLRTSVMLLSILLSTILLFVSLSIGASYESAQKKMARGMTGSATISVTTKDSATGISLDDIPDLPEIGVKVGIITGSAIYHKEGYYESMDLIAAEIKALNQINKLRLVNGEEITDFSGNQVILPDRFTSKFSIEKGDLITLQVKGMPVTFEVGEIAAYDTIFLRQTRGTTALFPLDTLRKLVSQTDGYNEILIEPAKGVTTAELKNALQNNMPNHIYDISEIVNEAQIAADARQKSMPFFLISFFALTISVFIIYSSYKVVTLDRLPIIGTFRSIGATEKEVTKVFLFESLIYGLLGGLFGIPIGMLILKFILRGIGKTLSNGIEIPVIISPLSIILPFAVAMVVSISSSWLPIRRASRLPIKDIVLGRVDEKHVSNKATILIGIVLFIISIILPRIAPKSMLYPAGGFSLLGLITAAILNIPLITNLISSGMERLYEVIFKGEGKLSARNIRDNKNVTQNIALLFISLSAVIVISVVGNFVTTYIIDVFHGAELDGLANGDMDQSFVEKVRNMDGIKKILPIYIMENSVQANRNNLIRLEATDNLDWYSSMFALNYSNGLLEQAFYEFHHERNILLSENCMDRTGISVNDIISLSYNGMEYRYRVIGSFKSRATDAEAVIPSYYATQDFGMQTYKLLAYTAVDPEAIIIQIRDLFGETPNWSRTVKEFTTDALATVEAFLQPMHSMTWLILLLATVGVINNLLINYIQKRRSIAMYKSVGLSNRQNIQITLLEGFSSGLIGAVIAVFVSYLEIQTIFLVAGPKITMVPELKHSTFILAGIAGIVINLIGSVAPILKSHQMKLVEEIKFE